MTNESTQLLEFINKSPSAFHACGNIAKMLKKAGFIELFENDAFALERGGRYFVTRNSSSVIAFTAPEDSLKGFNITACHSDSPTYKIKRNAEAANNPYASLNTEGYGGMLDFTWLDRPLSVAGRVFIKKQNAIEERLVNLDRDLLLIPSLAPHIAKTEKFNPACDMVPVYGSCSSRGGLLNEIASSVNEKAEDIIDFDLYLYNRMPGTVWGEHNEFISSPKLDDLMCAYSAVCAICQSAPQRHTLNVCAVFDNEEVGSITFQGAASTFMYDVLKRAALALGEAEAGFLSSVASGFIVSADNAHALHPNHPEFSDTAHRLEMNNGVVIKHHSGGRYITDGATSALFEAVCRNANVPTQHFYNRSDMLGGSTLGNKSVQQVSLMGVDIGLAQLAMHSSYETAGEKDTRYLISALKEFHKTEFVKTQSGWRLS